MRRAPLKAETPELNGYLPPASPEAEQSVLGAILVRPSVLERVLESIGPEDFYREAHGWIFRAMIDLHSAGEPVDLVTVSTYLRDRGQLEGVGGPVFLATLSEQVGFAVNADYYAKVIAEKAVLRRLLDVTQEIAAACFAHVENLPEFLAQAEAKVFAQTHSNNKKGGARRLKELMGPVVEKLEDLHYKKIDLTGLPSGFTDIDRMTGGFQDEDMIVLAGRPGQGKTGLALNICANLSLQAVPSLFFSLEMGSGQLVRRLIASQGKLDTVRLRDGKLTPNEWVTLYQVRGNIEDAPIFIDDASSLTPLEIHSRTRRMVSQEGIRLVVIDYLQRVKTPRGRSMAEEVGRAAQTFKTMAKDLKIPVVVLAQLNRDCESRDDKRPLLNDLKASGDIEQEADVVTFIYRDAYYFPEKTKKPGIAEIIFRKHRNGPLGTVELGFDGSSVTFRNLEKEEPPSDWRERY